MDDPRQALMESVRLSAEHGDPDALYVLGLWLADPLGPAHDPEQSRICLLRAARQGHVGALLKLRHGT